MQNGSPIVADGFMIYTKDGLTQITFLLSKPSLKPDLTPNLTPEGNPVIEIEKQGTLVLAYPAVKMLLEALTDNIKDHQSKLLKEQSVDNTQSDLAK